MLLHCLQQLLAMPWAAPFQHPKTLRHTGTQALRHSGTQTLRHSDTQTPASQALTVSTVGVAEEVEHRAAHILNSLSTAVCEACKDQNRNLGVGQGHTVHSTIAALESRGAAAQAGRKQGAVVRFEG
jgi:hypothetical protein